MAINLRIEDSFVESQSTRGKCGAVELNRVCMLADDGSTGNRRVEEEPAQWRKSVVLYGERSRCAPRRLERALPHALPVTPIEKRQRFALCLTGDSFQKDAEPGSAGAQPRRSTEKVPKRKRCESNGWGRFGRVPFGTGTVGRWSLVVGHVVVGRVVVGRVVAWSLVTWSLVAWSLVA